VGYLPTDVPSLKRELSQRNLSVSGTFVMRHLEDAELWPEIEKDLVLAGTMLQSLGAKFLVLIDDAYTDLFTGAPSRPSRLSDSGWRQLIETTHKVADLARTRFGLQTVFHPHAETHVEYEDQIERFLAETDPRTVSLCLDTGHHAYRGGDPVAFLRKHHKRISYLHLKSVDRDIQKKVEREAIPFAKAVAIDMFCEPSKGAVDFPALRDVLQDVDFQGYGIVEQDMFPAPPDKPFPIAKRTRDYLRQIGIG
jgi:inosose dehydratase